MNKTEKRLAPELRFPEFRNEEAWEMKKIEEVLVESRIPSNENDVNKRITVRLNQKGVEKREVRGTESENATYFYKRRKGQFIYGKQNLHKGAFGLIPDELDNFESSQDIPTFDFKSGFSSKYFVHYLGQDKIYLDLEKISTGTGSKRIHPNDLFKISFPFPKLIEQQKIASCLSSLDDVIAAHTGKLENLKQYKKGLLQNVFPQEGTAAEALDAKVPKLRFKEFENDGEWEEKSFDKLFEIGNGRDYKHLDKGEIPVYGSGGYMLSVNDYLYDGESVCIGRKGTIDKPMFLSGKFWTVDTLFYTHSFKKCLPKYIFYVFQNIDWLKHNEAGGVPSLSKTNIYRIQTKVPKQKEQQKIASLLSSVDDLIQAEADKIAQLKAHKKGLLQGLFPKIES